MNIFVFYLQTYHHNNACYKASAYKPALALVGDFIFRQTKSTFWIQVKGCIVYRLFVYKLYQFEKTETTSVNWQSL